LRGAARVASRRGSGRRKGRRGREGGREREVSYSSQLGFFFVVLFGFASSSCAFGSLSASSFPPPALCLLSTAMLFL
jgi:hypothetical protein